MTMSIRQATSTDITALCGLMEQLSGQAITPSHMADRLAITERSENDTIYVYEERGDVLGVLVFRIRENIREVSRYGEICIVVVTTTAKRRGIGKRLMEFAEQRAHELECKGTYLISGFGRKDEAHRFYLSLGYEITGYRFVKIFMQGEIGDEQETALP